MTCYAIRWTPARCVSIHTPTQGVTFYHLLKINFYPVSIHTPTQGVTISPHSRRPTGRSFNPHTHAGCDKRMEGEVSLPDVSIHTPTQGVTGNQGGRRRLPRVSIHTPTQGVTSINFIGNKLTTVSIHTPTQGVTTVLLCLLFSIPGFNPHTHAGCDKDEANIEDVALVSIHTPTQGVTHLCASVQKTQKFQSTHPRRV